MVVIHVMLLMMRNIWRQIVAIIFMMTLAIQAQASSFTQQLDGLTKQMPVTYEDIILMDESVRKDLACLAYNIYFEARGSNRADQIGVAWVVMNRLGHPEFKNKVCDVVFQTDYHGNRVVSQFSWTRYRQNLLRIEWDCWQRSQELAYAVYFRLESDPTRGAIYFRDSNGAKPKTTAKYSIIGGHIFIRDTASR